MDALMVDNVAGTFAMSLSLIGSQVSGSQRRNCKRYIFLKLQRCDPAWHEVKIMKKENKRLIGLKKFSR